MRSDPAFATRPCHLAMATLLAVLGVGICMQLTRLHFLPADLGCHSRGCQQVLASRYATLVGVPLALYGGGCYVLILGLLAAVGLSRRRADRLLAIRLLRVVVVLMAVAEVALLGVQLLQLHALCAYCLTATVISVGLAWWAILWTAAPGLLVPEALVATASDRLPRAPAPAAMPHDPSPAAEHPAPTPQDAQLRPVDLSGQAGSARVPTAVAPLVWSGCASVLVVLAAIAVMGAVRAQVVVARTGGEVVHAAEIDAASAGIRAIQARLGIDLQRALLVNRIDHALLLTEAQRTRDRGAPGQAGVLPGAATAAEATQASTVQRLRLAAGTTILIPMPAAVVQPADWAAAYQTGSPTAPDQLLVVIDPGCGLCCVQVRELLTLAGLPTGPWSGSGSGSAGMAMTHPAIRLGVLLRTQPDDAVGLVVAEAVAAADAQHHVWEFLAVVAQRDDPTTWDLTALAAAAQGLGMSGPLLHSDAASPRLRQRIDLQSASARRLLGDDATPRLFYDDQALCGFAPGPALAGLVATEAAIRASDLGR